MTRALSLATAVAALVLGTAAAALAGPARAAGEQGGARLEVRSAIYRPDSDTVTLTFRCVGSRRQCRGVLRTTFSGEDGRDATVPRSITLRPHRMRTVTLAVARHGMAAGDVAFGEGRGRAMLGPQDHRLSGGLHLVVRPTCATGDALAAGDRVRVFRVAPFGVYACLRPNGEPQLVADETYAELGGNAVDDVAVAGRFVAFTEVESYECERWSIRLYDVFARRVVRSRTGSLVDIGASCDTNQPIQTPVLRPSGGMAWIEGAPGRYVVRALDAGGDRVLDDGAAIAPDALALADDGTVAWVDGGALRTATLR